MEKEYTREEREKALFHVCATANELVLVVPPCCVEAHDALVGCIPIPKEELEALERALWVGMQDSNYPEWFLEAASGEVAGAILLEAEMVDLTPTGTYNWTPKAHAFAQRMTEKK